VDARLWSGRTWAAVLVLTFGLLAGCAPAPRETPPSGLASTADVLTRSLAEGDRDSFLAAFDSSAHARSTGARWFDNLTQFDEVVFAATTATGFQVTARVPGDQDSRHQVTVAPSAEDPAKLRGLVPGVRDPLWAVEAVSLITTEAGTVVLGEGADSAAATWTARVDRAVTALDEVDPGALTTGWNRRLLVEVPAQAASFGRVSGESVEAAAVTMTAGDSVRIVVNPRATAALDAAALDALILHEAVHAAVGTPHHPQAPRWLVEGLAEWVVNRADPASRAKSRRLVKQYLDTRPTPAALPTDRQVLAGGPDPLTGYALAEVAVDAMVARLGKPAATTALAGLLSRPPSAWTPSEQAITRWYLDALDRR